MKLLNQHLNKVLHGLNRNGYGLQLLSMTYFATAKANLMSSYQSVVKNSEMLSEYSPYSSDRVCINVTWKLDINLGQGAEMCNRNQ